MSDLPRKLPVNTFIPALNGRHDRFDPARAASSADAARDGSVLSEPATAQAYLTVFNTLAGITRQPLDTVQADTDRLWKQLPSRRKRDIATNPAAAAAIVADAMRVDPALSLKLPQPAARTPAASTAPFFDAGGQTRLDKVGNGNPSASYSKGYGALASTSWNPTTGIAGLTAGNFASSPFAQAGLDLATTRYLAGQQFSTPQILHAGLDAKALGLDTHNRATVRAFAVLDRFDPTGRQQRNAAYGKYDKWQNEHKAEIDKLHAAVDSATDEASRKAAIAARDAFLKQGQDQTGVSAVGDRLNTTPPASGAKPADRDDAIAGHGRIINEINKKHKHQVHEMGIQPARSLSDGQLAGGVDKNASEGPAGKVRAKIDGAAAAHTSTSAAADMAANLGLGARRTALNTGQPVSTAKAEPSASKDEPAKPVNVATAEPIPQSAGKSQAKANQRAMNKPPSMTV